MNGGALISIIVGVMTVMFLTLYFVLKASREKKK